MELTGWGILFLMILYETLHFINVFYGFKNKKDTQNSLYSIIIILFYFMVLNVIIIRCRFIV